MRFFKKNTSQRTQIQTYLADIICFYDLLVLRAKYISR
ncbi:MAG: hypothetical protein ACD_62C00232G0002 [uncultured bacterium]|nr:MAG: hypothetical protein ACD_62C00232G0002 [uncultured bacterium]